MGVVKWFKPDGTTMNGVITEATSAVVTEERNGAFTLDIELRDNTLDIQNNDILIAKPSRNQAEQQFRVKSVIKDERFKTQIYAEHISYTALDITGTNGIFGASGTADTLVKQWATMAGHGFTAVSNITTTADVNLTLGQDYQNFREILGGTKGSIIDKVGGEIRWENKYLRLFKQRGREGVGMLSYGKNIVTLDQEVNITNTYTSVIGYAIDSNTKQITVSPIVDSATAGNFPNQIVKPIDFSSEFNEDNPVTVDKIQRLAQDYVAANNVGIPKVSIKVDFVDLYQSAELTALQDDIELCDLVNINFPRLKIQTMAKVVSTQWDVLKDKYKEITIGDQPATITKQFNEIKNDVNNVVNHVNNVIGSSDGIHNVFYGEDEPVGAKKGDTWYKPVGEDVVEFYVWTGDHWELVMTSMGIPELQEELDKVKDAIDDAVEASNQAVENANTAVQNANNALESISGNQQAITDLQDLAEQNSNAIDDALSRVNNLGDSFNGLQSTVEDKADKSQVTQLAGQVTSVVAQNEWALDDKSVTIDANNITTNSRIVNGGNTRWVNGPAGGNVYGYVQTEIVPGNIRRQTWWDRSTGLEPKQYQRSYTRGTWTAWTQVANKSDVDTVRSELIQTTDMIASRVEGKTDKTEFTQFKDSITTTVTGKADQSQVTQLSNQISSIVSSTRWKSITSGVIDLNGFNQEVKLAFSGSVSIINKPAGSEQFGYFEVRAVEGDTNVYQQTWAERTTGYTWTRNYRLGVWSEWIRSARQSDITALQTEITQTNEQIKLSATKTELGTVNTQLSGQINILNDQINQTVSQIDGLSDVPNFFQGSHIDYRNDKGEWKILGAGITERTSVSPDGQTYQVYATTSAVTMESSIAFYSPVNVSAGDYTGSVYIYNGKATVSGLKLQMIEWGSGSNYTAAFLTLKPGWNTITVTNTLTANATGVELRLKNLPEGMSVGVNSYVLNKGTKAYPWRMNQADIVNKSQITQTIDNINLSVQGKADKDKIISQINISKEGILIDGAKNHITGQTTIDNGVIKSAMIGNAQILDAHIGSITADKITAGTINASKVNIINLDVNNIVGLNSQFVTTLWNGSYTNTKVFDGRLETSYDDGYSKVSYTGQGFRAFYRGVNILDSSIGSAGGSLGTERIYEMKTQVSNGAIYLSSSGLGQVIIRSSGTYINALKTMAGTPINPKLAKMEGNSENVIDVGTTLNKLYEKVTILETKVGVLQSQQNML